jgi:hypothetical protein
MSYSSSSINTVNYGTPWSAGQLADGIAISGYISTTTLTSGVIDNETFTIGRGTWLFTINVTVTIRDNTTAWSPSLLGLYGANSTSLISGTSICGSATYTNGTVLRQTLTCWTNCSTVGYTTPFSIQFTPVFAGSTTAPTYAMNYEAVKIR